MVGYVYSVDVQRGYNYILIKAYDMEDLFFADENAPCDIYRLNRSTGEAFYPKHLNFNQKLSLEQIESIAYLVIGLEADDDYPRKISWEIIPGGKVNERGSEDLKKVWYVPTEVIDTNSDYINISDICFDKKPTNLEASFFANTLRQMCHGCEIYSDDTFAECGGEIFCTSDMMHYEKAIFGTMHLYSRFKGRCPKPRQRLKFSKKDFSVSLEELAAISATSCIAPLTPLIDAQRDAGIALAKILKYGIDNSKSVEWLFHEIKPAIYGSYSKLLCIHNEFHRRTGCSKTDMQYLNLRELHDILSFADKAMSAAALIRKNRRRKAYLKEITAPTVIHKGNLY